MKIDCLSGEGSAVRRFVQTKPTNYENFVAGGPVWYCALDSMSAGSGN